MNSRGRTGNFWARYVNGNRTNIKGIKNAHFNIRSIRNKMFEVKNIKKLEKLHIFGLSECELKKENFDEKILKIPGYDVLFPKSWNVHGFARTLVYVKKTLDYQQVFDLENDLVQSIWLKGGFKNGKKIYFCHAYREHSSAIGNTINSQKDYLNILLAQWEAATSHNFPTEPNEVHVSLDMNLDFLPNKWQRPSYRLCSLTNLVQNTCNTSNFTQLVTEPTRYMYNSVTETTEVSCIDHIYCNSKYKCSTPTITVSGASDHDIISYTRYTKAPPSPARTIRRRSYKEFIDLDFLTDMSVIDWSEVYTATDVDTATDIFTEQFVNVLNMHAPWIIYQQRKNFSPWISDDTKEMMKQRDTWKSKAEVLAAISPGSASEEQKEAWTQYIYYRNKINNRKKFEENHYKKESIYKDIDNPANMWRTSKKFMNWKSTGIPTQIEVGKLVTSARQIAELMNNFFIEKVMVIRAGMREVDTNFSHCTGIMENKNCSLKLSHVSVKEV